MIHPSPCSECGKLEVFPSVIEDYKIKGVLIPKLHILRCRACNEIYFDSESFNQMEKHYYD